MKTVIQIIAITLTIIGVIAQPAATFNGATLTWFTGCAILIGTVLHDHKKENDD